MDNEQLKRIADAIEEILRLVKADQERSRAYMEREKNGLPTIETDEQKTRASNGPSLPAACALAHGSGTELQATSLKLQATSRKLDKIKL